MKEAAYCLECDSVLHVTQSGPLFYCEACDTDIGIEQTDRYYRDTIRSETE